MNLHKPAPLMPSGTKIDGKMQFLYCDSCGKRVSTGFYPVPTDTPDRGLIVRAFIQCPECMEERP